MRRSYNQGTETGELCASRGFSFLNAKEACRHSKVFSPKSTLQLGAGSEGSCTPVSRDVVIASLLFQRLPKIFGRRVQIHAHPIDGNRRPSRLLSFLSTSCVLAIHRLDLTNSASFAGRRLRYRNRPDDDVSSGNSSSRTRFEIHRRPASFTTTTKRPPLLNDAARPPL